jgi:hypothetical protein
MRPHRSRFQLGTTVCVRIGEAIVYQIMRHQPAGSRRLIRSAASAARETANAPSRNQPVLALIVSNPICCIGGDTPRASIVLFSDGEETAPSNPNSRIGAFTAARASRDQGIPISTISFGTPNGYVDVDGQRRPVPVDDTTMKKVAQLSWGTAYSATTLQQLTDV